MQQFSVNQQPTMVGQPQVTVVTMPPSLVGCQSTRMTCPSCKHEISTHIVKKPSHKAWFLGFGLAMFCCLCCACIPCFMDSLKSTEHYCTSCNAYLGKHDP